MAESVVFTLIFTKFEKQSVGILQTVIIESDAWIHARLVASVYESSEN